MGYAQKGDTSMNNGSSNLWSQVAYAGLGLGFLAVGLGIDISFVVLSIKLNPNDSKEELIHLINSNPVGLIKKKQKSC